MDFDVAALPFSILEMPFVVDIQLPLDARWLQSPQPSSHGTMSCILGWEAFLACFWGNTATCSAVRLWPSPDSQCVMEGATKHEAQVFRSRHCWASRNFCWAVMRMT